MPETNTALDSDTGTVPQRVVTTQVRLVRRPVGELRPDDLELVRAEISGPGPGQVLVRNEWMSVDPYMRGRMDDVEGAIPPFAPGGPLDGAAVGTVVASRAADVPVGAAVLHQLGWREHAVLDGAAAVVVDAGTVPPQAHLGVLGTPGLTAWITVTETAPVRPGDVVFVSAAAGAVGTVAGRLARRFGAARVIGSAGGPEKARRLVEEFGYDRALDRRAGPIDAQLAAAAPEGIDVYLDAVGGDHLEAAVGAMRVGGRVALVGAIGGYDATTPRPGPANLFRAVGNRITLRGMMVVDHFDRWDEWRALATPWVVDGSLRGVETVREGLASAPAALIGVLRGDNTGKMLVRLG
ncbi:NADP-dependent oxidoreductase [Pseudonocardia humida]|uniref:NADP-dependent oxidoreductase n=1 Tax=Pseudonocardia humida TaxID=2800819 RepID=A0ABT1A9F5_9PSEU|nr:NADP-dependent oxidoreductase [Pseudonocardia humida]MCO1659647.1 NADP-dependent oxidoreductase [Pseudonocardia humida]